MTESKILDRVRALLAIAEHPNTTMHEADTALTQANRLMAKHAIDEAIVRAGQNASERRAPSRSKVSLSGSWNEFMPSLRTILGEIAHANRCRVVLIGGREAELFGMDEDVRWVEMLYTSVYVQFLTKINPRWDAEKSYDENIYNFKVAGNKWEDIDYTAMMAGSESGRDKSGYYHKLVRAYRRHCKLIGDVNPVSTTSFKQFRAQFTNSFVAHLCRRIRAMAEDSAEEAAKVPGSALALADMSDSVRDAFEQAYPEFSREEQAKRDQASREARDIARIQEQKDFDEIGRAQKYDRLESEQRKERAAAKRNNKYWDEQDRKHQSSANARGRAAAASVDLSRKAGSTGAANKREALR